MPGGERDSQVSNPKCQRRLERGGSGTSQGCPRLTLATCGAAEASSARGRGGQQQLLLPICLQPPTPSSHSPTGPLKLMEPGERGRALPSQHRGTPEPWGGGNTNPRWYLRWQRQGTSTVSPVVPALVGGSCWQQGQPPQVSGWWIAAAFAGDGWAGSGPQEEAWIHTGETTAPQPPHCHQSHMHLPVPKGFPCLQGSGNIAEANSISSRNNHFPTAQTQFSCPSQQPQPQQHRSALKPQPWDRGG